MSMDICPMSKVNLSSSVKNYLYQYIRSLEQTGNMKLPPESELSLKLGVSRVTVRRALDELENEGIILRIQGRGTFVNCGYHASVEVKAVRRKEADLETGKLLGLEPGEEIYEVEKVYFADGHPAIISVDCFACDLIGIDLTCEFMAGRSIFEVLHQYGGCFIARDKISMETMNREEMEKSVVSGKEMECDSVLVFRGKNYNQENKLVMLDREFYDTRYIQFSLLRVKNV